MSAPGFLADALAVAGIDRRRLDELRAILSQQRDRCAGIAAFVRAIAGLIREARFGGAPRNPARLRPYTSPEGLAEMAALQSTAPDWVAVAVAQVAETHPEALVASTIGTSTRRT